MLAEWWRDAVGVTVPGLTEPGRERLGKSLHGSFGFLASLVASEAVTFCYLQTFKEGRASASLKCPEEFSIKSAFPGSFVLRTQDDGVL
jgi:hypothetical protein